MTIAVLTTLTLVVALGVYGVAKAERLWRTPIELRGDWWSRFERQFRAYDGAQQRTEYER